MRQADFDLRQLLILGYPGSFGNQRDIAPAPGRSIDFNGSSSGTTPAGVEIVARGYDASRTGSPSRRGRSAAAMAMSTWADLRHRCREGDAPVVGKA